MSLLLRSTYSLFITEDYLIGFMVLSTQRSNQLSLTTNWANWSKWFLLEIAKVLESCFGWCFDDQKLWIKRDFRVDQCWFVVSACWTNRDVVTFSNNVWVSMALGSLGKTFSHLPCYVIRDKWPCHNINVNFSYVHRPCYGFDQCGSFSPQFSSLISTTLDSNRTAIRIELQDCHNWALQTRHCW